jgi:hypothetical protein
MKSTWKLAVVRLQCESAISMFVPDVSLVGYMSHSKKAACAAFLYVEANLSRVRR